MNETMAALIELVGSSGPYAFWLTVVYLCKGVLIAGIWVGTVGFLINKVINVINADAVRADARKNK